jgi:hypothetical protein
MPTKHVVNCSTGEQTYVEMTDEEAAAHQAAAEAAEALQIEQDAAAGKRQQDKESGNQKLKDLGLTDDEIAAITS